MLGGIETISAVLAREFVKAGHKVHVITQTPGGEADEFPFAVTRQPSRQDTLRLARWSDVFFQNNISLQTLFAALPAQRRVVVVYQTWIRRMDGSPCLHQWLKAQVSRIVPRNVAVSRAIASTIPARCQLIPNPYDHRTFRNVDGVNRRRDLVFVGRLVSDKGCDLLLDALHELRLRGTTPDLTIIGKGPEEAALRERTEALGLAKQVTFAGPLRGEDLCLALNRHRLMVVPSRWAEPFGVVALEGAACGCGVIGSNAGGLPDAIGPCGWTFPNGDTAALTNLIEGALLNPAGLEKKLEHAPVHLAKHRGNAIASSYLSLFAELVL